MGVQGSLGLSGEIGARLQAFKEKRLCILLDDAEESSRAVLVAPASEITADEVNRLLTITTGILLVAISPLRAQSFLLAPMRRTLQKTTTGASTPYQLLTSIEAREGVTTGISSEDRASTLRVVAEELPNARRLVQPGHIFPVLTREGGVLVKNALPEGALDLVKICGYSDAAAFIELLDGEGRFVRRERALALGEHHQVPLFSLSDLVQFRLRNEELVKLMAEARLPTVLAGELRSYIYRSVLHDGEHLALVKGKINKGDTVLTRVQAENTLSDVFGGESPASRRQLQASLSEIGKRGCGVLLYLRRSTTGQLTNQLLSHESSQNTPPAALMREYGIGAQILRHLGVRKIELLTTSSKRLVGLEQFGIEVIATKLIV